MHTIRTFAESIVLQPSLRVSTNEAEVQKTNHADMKTLMTSALPYANGPLHLGHLAGAYLPADIFCPLPAADGQGSAVGLWV